MEIREHEKTAAASGQPDDQRPVTDASRRERWCAVKLRRAVDLTYLDVIRWQGNWTEILGVYRSMDEWEAEFGAIGDIVDPEILPGQPNPEYRQAVDALAWASPTWVLLRLHNRFASDPGVIADTVIKVYMYDLFETQALTILDSMQ
jgi:hypothetical protein